MWPSHGLLLAALLVAEASTATGDDELGNPGILHSGYNVKLDLLQESVEAIPSLAFEAEGWPEDACKVSGQTCEFQENLLSIVPNIQTIDECELICKDNSECTFFTYFGEDNSQFSENCILFSSCDNLVTCTDCSTTQYGKCSLNLEPISFCSHPVVGHIGENLLQFLPNLPNQIDCLGACLNTPDCSHYTHHNASSQMVPNGCFLFSSLQAPFAPCEFCQTGPANCSTNQCMLSTAGEVSESLMITNSSQPTTVDVFALGMCTLTVVAVGGGGDGSNGGGGSGFVEWRQLNLVDENMTLTVKVGGAGENTSVRHLIKFIYDKHGTGKTIVAATSGHSGERYNGGDGYCGGGGTAVENGQDPGISGGDGGTNGGNGHRGTYRGSGGSGSHMKLDEIPTSGFALSPGKGGYGRSGGGGGGGGVLVDSEPAGEVEAGEGYGGGGTTRPYIAGKPGVVLFMFT